MYYDVVSLLYANQRYDIYMSSEKAGFRKSNILHETEIVGKNNVLMIVINI